MNEVERKQWQEEITVLKDEVVRVMSERDEAVRLLERVKLENDDNCIHSDLAVDINAFLAPKEAEHE
ncbi:MAG: hypothetical protein ABIH23_16860 [bacterium]